MFCAIFYSKWSVGRGEIRQQTRARILENKNGNLSQCVPTAPFLAAICCAPVLPLGAPPWQSKSSYKRVDKESMIVIAQRVRATSRICRSRAKQHCAIRYYDIVALPGIMSSLKLDCLHIDNICKMFQC